MHQILVVEGEHEPYSSFSTAAMVSLLCSMTLMATSRPAQRPLNTPAKAARP